MHQKKTTKFPNVKAFTITEVLTQCRDLYSNKSSILVTTVPIKQWVFFSFYVTQQLW